MQFIRQKIIYILLCNAVFYFFCGCTTFLTQQNKKNPKIHTDVVSRRTFDFIDLHNTENSAIQIWLSSLTNTDIVCAQSVLAEPVPDIIKDNIETPLTSCKERNTAKDHSRSRYVTILMRTNNLLWSGYSLKKIKSYNLEAYEYGGASHLEFEINASIEKLTETFKTLILKQYNETPEEKPDGSLYFYSEGTAYKLFRTPNNKPTTIYSISFAD
jgi:hypothetical protein